MSSTSADASSGSSSPSDHPPLPESPPSELVERPLPPIDERQPIAPDSECDVEAGDLVVIHVGTDVMEWYGFLVLDTYTSKKLCGLALPNYQYADRERESWVEWAIDHLGKDHIGIYKDVAPRSASESVEE